MAPKKTAPPAPRVPRPGPRGWAGPGGGAQQLIQPAPEWRATTVQACGLWPFSAGSGTPMVGVPLGRSILTGATVCCDPISWFMRAGLILNPSAFVLGQPGLGKSTVIRRMALGLAAFGVHPMVFGDLKPDYVDLTRALGGQVITLGRGRGYLNVLDPGETTAIAQRLTGDRRRALQADAHGRRLHMVSALITILRKLPPTDREETILNAALLVLDERTKDGRVPVLSDLVQVIKEAPEHVRTVALDRGDIDRYRDITEHLESSLTSLLGSGRLGDTFSRPTSEPMRRDTPVCFDISGIDDSETDLQAAALLSCWSYGFGAINAAQTLADAGLEPQRHYLMVMDELWRVLQAGSGLVSRVDALTRLNRTKGVGTAMVTHTMKDLLSLPDEADRLKAKGFAERAGMVITAGLPREEMPRLGEVVEMTSAEQKMVTSWSMPPGWDRRDAPPGLGNFLIKVGGRPGVPVHVDLTPAEMEINNTNRRWQKAGAA